MRKKTFISMGAALALGLFGMASAQATIISGTSTADFTNGSYTLSLANGAATFSFNNSMDSNFPDAQVKTGGTGLVATNSPFVGGGPAAFFTADRAPFIDGSDRNLTTFQAYDSFTTISNSSTPTDLGLAFDLSDGRHYGYAEISGTEFLGYGYESVAGVGIQAGAMGPTPVPEPGSLVMLAFGLALVGAGTAAARSRRI